MTHRHKTQFKLHKLYRKNLQFPLSSMLCDARHLKRCVNLDTQQNHWCKYSILQNKKKLSSFIITGGSNLHVLKIIIYGHPLRSVIWSTQPRQRMLNNKTTCSLLRHLLLMMMMLSSLPSIYNRLFMRITNLGLKLAPKPPRQGPSPPSVMLTWTLLVNLLNHPLHI